MSKAGVIRSLVGVESQTGLYISQVGLKSGCDRIAYDGEQAMDRLDEGVDVVLLDRRMPGISGDEVLARVRDGGYDCRVAMVTAVKPASTSLSWVSTTT